VDGDDNNGWMGHLILSKFPFDSKESIAMVDGGDTNSAGTVTYPNQNEDRGAAYVTVTVDGIKLDVFAMSNGAAENWNAKVGTGKSIAEIINGSSADAWLAMGNLHTDSSAKLNTVKGYLTKGAATADVDASGWTEYIAGSTNLSYSDKVLVTAATLQGKGWNYYAWQFATVTLPEKQATVSFNANGGTGTMTDVKAIGNYTLPANGFTAPTGHQFKGWATSANGEVLPSLSVTEDVELFAIWEPVSLKLMQWWINNPSTSDMALIKQEVATRNVDIVALISINNQASAATYAAEFGYPHYYFAAQPGTTTTRGNILLSKYPIEFIKTQNVVRSNGTVNYMDCFQVNVAGAELDVYTGYDVVPSSAATYIQTNKAESGNDFVMLMHVGWTLSSSYAGETITASSYPNGAAGNVIALSQNDWQLVGSFTTPAIGVGITTAGVNKTVIIGTIQYKAN
jgi:hypothetical protein